MLRLTPDGAARIVQLGTDLARGMRPQALVPKGVWQGARLMPGGNFALLGATVSPGFEFSDFELGRRDDLLRAYPEFSNQIQALTR
jgi:hypothetical protein